ncbi:MAG: hypothetical protein NTV51_14140 [Verrucomicrobia bacterium]|nr:hypothetical protein [Verrucomicrobiota bacterium]
MKKSTLALLGLSAALFVGSAVAADTKKAAPAAPAPAEKQQKLVRVSTLKNVEANREFQANVQLLQAQRQAAIELNASVEKETNPIKKNELKTKLDELMNNLNENNQKMVKAYGFSLDCNYTLVIETAHVYMLVSDEEAAKIEKEEAARAAAEKKK